MQGKLIKNLYMIKFIIFNIEGEKLENVGRKIQNFNIFIYLFLKQ